MVVPAGLVRASSSSTAIRARFMVPVFCKYFEVLILDGSAMFKVLFVACNFMLIKVAKPIPPHGPSSGGLCARAMIHRNSGNIAARLRARHLSEASALGA